jgi:glycosyltransferase involved in cell wall biosynthesis
MIVQIVSDFFSGGTVAMRAVHEVQALLDAGHRVTVITDSDDKHNLFLQEKSSNLLHIMPVRSFALPRLYAVSKELPFVAQCYKALNDLAKTASIDLVVSHGSTPCYAVAPFSRHQNLPNVFVVHALIRDKIGTSANPYSWVTTQMYRHANRYGASNMHYSVAVSRHIRRLSIAEGAKPANTFVLHNAVDNEIFNPDEDGPKDIDVLFIGRLVAEKGLGVLVEAAKRLSRETRISIVGDGPLRLDLERQARQVQAKIVFHGWIQNHLVPQYLRRAKLKVLPSLSDAFPGVVLEAMACGVPVIGSNTGGIPDMVEHGVNGWLLPPNDARGLATTIEAVLSNNRKRKAAGFAAYQTAQSFSVDQFSRKLVSLYEKIMESFDSRIC